MSKLQRGDFYDTGDHQWMLRFEGKDGKSSDMPVHHDPLQMIAALLTAQACSKHPRIAGEDD